MPYISQVSRHSKNIPIFHPDCIIIKTFSKRIRSSDIRSTAICKRVLYFFSVTMIFQCSFILPRIIEHFTIRANVCHPGFQLYFIYLLQILFPCNLQRCHNIFSLLRQLHLGTFQCLSVNNHDNQTITNRQRQENDQIHTLSNPIFHSCLLFYSQHRVLFQSNLQPLPAFV